MHILIKCSVRDAHMHARTYEMLCRSRSHAWANAGRAVSQPYACMRVCKFCSACPMSALYAGRACMRVPVPPWLVHMSATLRHTHVLQDTNGATEAEDAAGGHRKAGSPLKVAAAAGAAAAGAYAGVRGLANERSRQQAGPSAAQQGRAALRKTLLQIEKDLPRTLATQVCA